MSDRTIVRRRGLRAPLLFVSLLWLLLLGGCQVGPYVEPAEPDPLPGGPGLFTGEQGYYVIGGSDDKKAEPEAEPAPQAAGAEPAPADFAEFEAYQRWKNEERHSEEYQEFRQWLRGQDPNAN